MLGAQCRPRINKPPPFEVLNIRIPLINPVKGRLFINQGSGLSLVQGISTEKVPNCHGVPKSKPATSLGFEGLRV